MVQFKLSQAVAFIIFTATIAPIVSLPTGGPPPSTSAHHDGPSKLKPTAHNHGQGSQSQVIANNWRKENTGIQIQPGDSHSKPAVKSFQVDNTGGSGGSGHIPPPSPTLSGASTERLVPFGYKHTPGIDPYSGKGGGSLKSFGTESGAATFASSKNPGSESLKSFETAATFASSKNPDPPTIKPDMMAVCSRMVHYLLRKCGMT